MTISIPQPSKVGNCIPDAVDLDRVAGLVVNAPGSVAMHGWVLAGLVIGLIYKPKAPLGIAGR